MEKDVSVEAPEPASSLKRAAEGVKRLSQIAKALATHAFKV
jgi:hypothetical protein